jgi:hypothetical protein
MIPREPVKRRQGSIKGKFSFQIAEKLFPARGFEYISPKVAESGLSS